MRVMLADDHPLFLEGLKNLLSARNIEVVGEARTGYEALEVARRTQPDLILMDIQMPVLDGLAATRLIKLEMPEIQIVMLSMSDEDDNIFEAIKSGASGYLNKTQDTKEFFMQLQKLENGEIALSPGLAVRIIKEFGRQPPRNTEERPSNFEERQSLSVRQMEVLSLVAQGLTYKEVGEKLHFSERTVKYHMGEIMERLHMQNRSEVVRYARRMGYVK